ncbi:hypothetical protein IV203_021851 [Nitzschia inconspicua]|uniref:Uncharacterized protein n=1 Tax=Nitzschia inconspicua TaxID=303405 RepID=A0A9K3K6H8_9STRA|nr:hypothetical protein IV203_033444 [Nitzschia inconspicua]KAG7343843.1 hypothetical protein IV203_021851 [Nitzschia inconspicua]
MSIDLIPSACLSILNNAVLPCIFDPLNGNCLPRCFDPAPAGSSLPIALDFLNIPLDAETCTEFEEPFCFPDILPGCCPTCAGALRRLYRCVALNDGPAMGEANIQVLARACPLDCNEYLLDIGVDIGSNATNITDFNITDTNSTNSSLF